MATDSREILPQHGGWLARFLASDGSGDNPAIQRWGRPVGVAVAPYGAKISGDARDLTPVRGSPTIKAVVRRLTAAALTLALQAGAWTAPWVHAHLDEHDADHHQGRVIHAHLPEESWDARHRPSLESNVAEAHAADDGTSIDLQVFVAVQSPPQTAPGLSAPGFELPTPPVHAAKVSVPAEGGHDPPTRTSISSRAPPLPTLS